MKLSPEQLDIINSSGNVIVRASAGTGKTEILVRKIADDLSKRHTHKVIGAITFTIKAANEIRERLSVDTSNCFIGTNNSFAIKEIIEPFLKNVYKTECDGLLSIDYKTKKEDFDKCIDYLKKYNRICSYSNSKKNFVFELALLIVKKSTACRKYLQAKYFKIFIDEYQDCDNDMHELFMYLCHELKIELFIVGDEKQSIYIWRGAYPQAFLNVYKSKEFNSKVLRENHRSCQQIQNYSNLLNDDTQSLYKKTDKDDSIILINATEGNWINKIKNYLDLDKTCALIRYKNDAAEKGAGELSSLCPDFTYIPKTPLSEVVCDISWLYNAVANSLIVDKYSYYDLFYNLPFDIKDSKEIKSIIRDNFNKIKNSYEKREYEKIRDYVQEIAEQFGYVVDNNHIIKLLKTVMNDRYHSAYLIDNLKHVSITIHSSKGLEYEQVIVFAEDYRLNDEESIYDHYVAVTRGKNKLIIIYNNNDYNAIQYRKNLCDIFSRAGVNPKEVLTIH